MQPGIDWGDDPRVLGPGFKILGGPDDGTFAEQVRVPAANVFAKPARLDWAAGGGAAAGRTHRLARALHARPPALGPDRADPGRRRGHLHVRRAVRACGRGARARHVGLGREDRALAWSSAPRPASTTARAAGSRRSSSAAAAASTSCSTRPAPGRRASRACARAAASSSSAAPSARPPSSTCAATTSGRSTSSGTMMGSPVDFRAMLRACETQSWTPVVDSARPLAQAGDALAPHGRGRALRQARPHHLTRAHPPRASRAAW